MTTNYHACALVMHAKIKEMLNQGDNVTRWIEHPDGKIYVRKRLRSLFYTEGYTAYKRRMLDIGQILILKPGNGIFTQLHDLLITGKDLNCDGIYIENVLEERFQNFFWNRGWFRKFSDRDDYGPIYDFYRVWKL